MNGLPAVASFSKSFNLPPVYTLSEKKFLYVRNSEITVNLISVSVIVPVAISSPFYASNSKSVIGRFPNIVPIFVGRVTISPTFMHSVSKYRH